LRHQGLVRRSVQFLKVQIRRAMGWVGRKAVSRESLATETQSEVLSPLIDRNRTNEALDHPVLLTIVDC
jgi:hypothetical protein